MAHVVGGMFIGGVWHIPGIFLVDGRQEVTSVKGGGCQPSLVESETEGALLRVKPKAGKQRVPIFSHAGDTR